MLKHFRNLTKLDMPDLLGSLKEVDFSLSKHLEIDSEIKKKFPKISFESVLELKRHHQREVRPLLVGCLFSGGPAPGGHNVVLGVYDGLKELHHKSRLIGFNDGLDGFLDNNYIELHEHILQEHKNLGGFYLLGSSRKKIQDDVDFEKAKKVVTLLGLDSLVIIGGDDSNTNAAILANYFKEQKINCSVLGIPKTIDGDLQNEFLEISFGFDTASKIYSEQIGNILNDAKSAKKYYHFIKLMGRSASHLTLECALNTHPNYSFISEEMTVSSLEDKVKELEKIIVERSLKGKNYGCILIPEGLLEYLPEFQLLINEIQKKNINQSEDALIKLSQQQKDFFSKLPRSIQNQIFLQRDPHGNIPLSQIQTEEVIIEWIKKRLENNKDFKGKFNPVGHFLGYEGRCGFPTKFDSEYCYALGKLSSKMCSSNLTGYMAGFKNLIEPTQKWIPYAIPLASLMHMKEISGKLKPVIEKTYVDLDSYSYRKFCQERQNWFLEDDYQCLGPIQFFGPEEIVNRRPVILKKN